MRYHVFMRRISCLLGWVAVVLLFSQCNKPQQPANLQSHLQYKSLYKLSRSSSFSNPDSLHNLAAGILADPFYRQRSHTAIRIGAHQLKAAIFLQQLAGDSVHYHLDRACELALATADTQKIVQSLAIIGHNSLGLVEHRRIEKWVNIATHYLSGVQVATEEHALTYALRAAHLFNESNYTEAQPFFFKAYQIFTNTRNYAALGYISINLSNLYKAIKSHDEDIKYLRLALSYMQHARDTAGIASVLNNLGTSYRSVNPDSAAHYYKFIIDSLPANDQYTLMAKFNLANLYVFTGEHLPEALRLYNEVKDRSEATNSKVGVLYANTGIAYYHFENKNYPLALQLYQEAAKVADTLGLTDISFEIKNNIVEALEKQGNYQQAFMALRAQKVWKDSVKTLQKQIAIHDLELFYERENQQLDTQKLLAYAENQQLNTGNRILIAVILIIIMLFSIALFLREQRRKSRQLQELEDKYRLLSELESRKTERTKLYEQLIAQQQEELMSIAGENASIRMHINEKQLQELITEDPSRYSLNAKHYWQHLTLKFNLLYPGFIERLQINHPKLTQNDIQFCMLTKLNIPLKDIAAIFNITITSLYKKKYRLEEKMNVKGSDKSLEEYLRQLCLFIPLICTLLSLTACEENPFTSGSDSLWLAHQRKIHQLSLVNNYEQPDSVLAFLQTVLADSLATKQLSPTVLIEAYQIKTKLYQQQGKLDSMFYAAHEACKIAETERDSQQIVRTLTAMRLDDSKQLRTRSILDKWIEVALAYQQGQPMNSDRAWVYAEYGSILSKRGQYPEAIKWLMEAYSLYKQYDADQNMGAICINVGNIYSAIGSQTEALKFQQLAVYHIKKSGQLQELAAALNNLGILYKSIDIDSAIYYFNYVIDSLPDGFKTAARYNLANLYQENTLREYDKAKALYADVLKESEAQNIAMGIFYAKSGLANLYLRQDLWEKALKMYREAEAGADSLGFTDVANSIRDNIILAYESQQNYVAAFKLLRRLEAHRDSSLALEKQVAIHDLELFYQSENQRLENQNLLARIENQQLLMRKRILIVSLLILLLFIISLLVIRKNRIKANQLRELEDKYSLLTEIEQVKSERASFLEKIVAQQQDELMAIARENDLIRKEFDDGQQPTSMAKEEEPELLGDKAYWQSLRQKFDLIYPGFVSTLQQNYPRLTEYDIQFCMLIKLNIPLKDVASIFNISMPGIYKKKYRLEEKLNLKGNDDRLHNFIAQL